MKYIASPTLGSGKLEANLMKIFVPRGWEMREGSLLPKLFWDAKPVTDGFPRRTSGFSGSETPIPLCLPHSPATIPELGNEKATKLDEADHHQSTKARKRLSRPLK